FFPDRNNLPTRETFGPVRTFSGGRLSVRKNRFPALSGTVYFSNLRTTAAPKRPDGDWGKGIPCALR
ncbi:hypothetical protein ACFMBG_21030, partial [Leisingera sp. D0M16]|uniref:hypothetical protein n=1 Tax=Leisingera coralii TaxID=3351347 RepID=UPI003B784812